MINHKIFPTADAVVKTLADDMLAYSHQGQPVHISLSGGSTPKCCLSFWQTSLTPTFFSGKTCISGGDERFVAPDDAESNYGEPNALLFSKFNMPAQNIHRILGENEPQAEPERFAQAMAHVIPTENSTPVFDLIILGVGADGHTVSLFPGLTDYADANLSVVASHPESGQLRVSKPRKCCKPLNASVISFLAQVTP
ncbi:6-phosphogluconolactonase [Vibrio cholerae]|nr:6-phosphogluconolactonase [Vibrio cholerae]